MSTLLQDARYAMRQLRKNPGFTLVAVLSLALGIGANTAIFTLIDGLILKSLPVPNPQQLVAFGNGTGGGEIDGIGPGPLDMFPYDFYKQIERQHDPFENVCAAGSFPVQVSVRIGEGSAAGQAIAQLVSGTFFGTLGVDPVLGRSILPGDTDAPGRNAVAVLSYRYWQQVLGSEPSVIGSGIVMNGTPFTVIGVAPPTFFGVELNAETPDLWVPITMQQEVMLQPSLLDPHGLFWIHMMGRRKQGISSQQAQAWTSQQIQQFMVEREGAQISDKRRTDIRQIYVEMLPGGRGVSHLREQFSEPLYILMGVVVLVLAIACANLANFLLAKAAEREREISTRLAMGASRSRIFRHVLTEALILSLLGGVAGLVLAFLGTRFLVNFLVEGSKSSALDPNPDLRTLAFTFGVSLLTGAFFGMAPAWRASRMRIATALSSSIRTASGTGMRSTRVLPRILVATQVALSLILLVGAGLFLRTLQNLKDQDFGFDRKNVLLIDFNAKLAGYKPEQLSGLHARIVQRLEALPGVRSASLSNGPPIADGNWTSPIEVQGYAAAPDEDQSTNINRVSSHYFDTVGIAVLRGRSIGLQDASMSPKVVVVNQTLAEHFFPKGDAIGHSFSIMDPGVPGLWQIVGVVRDTKYNDPREEPKRMIYLPLEQMTADDHYAYSMEVRADGDPSKIANGVRVALAEVDPTLPLLEMKTISEHINTFMENERLISQLAGFFSLLALSLACVGLYGVMSYNVVQRTNEIGVRIALGARSSGILWMVLRESVMLLAVGLGVGVPATLATTRAVRSQLFGLSPFDVNTIAMSILMIAAVVLVAAYLPAQRASKIDPVVALRYE
jgi:predicted permease